MRRRLSSDEQQGNDSPQVIPAKQHKIKRQNVSPNALKTVQRLQNAGFEAYLVGGSVRDLLLGRKPKDYDVATNARPGQVRSLFKRSRVIGRRFKLVHVYFKGETMEVATFRANVDKEAQSRQHTEEGMIVRDNVFGSLDEDAWRRDFTVNAFYYDPTADTVLDYVGGMQDLRSKTVAVIGDPQERFQEDPIRLLRAIRFAAKLDFELEEQLKNELLKSHELLGQVPGSRLYDAFIQVFFAGYAEAMYRWMLDTGYFKILFEQTSCLLADKEHKNSAKLIENAMCSTDKRYHQGKSLNPGFLLSVILWPPLMHALQHHKKKGQRLHRALHSAIEEVLVNHQASMLVLPMRMISMIRQIWLLQFALKQRRPSRVRGIVGQRYFRAAFDLLEMRSAFEPALVKVVDWWQKFQQAEKPQRDKMVEALQEESQRGK
ncbi:MAG: polynucleotide adenylyltransferase PcnB [Coxiellaceae bacterium]|nr:polynucleotide adenylyltransferase PcnB [Coxiellaceae bacterium]